MNRPHFRGFDILCGNLATGGDVRNAKQITKLADYNLVEDSSSKPELVLGTVRQQLMQAA